MAKRKTRQQKVIADLRRQVYATKLENFSIEKPLEKKSESVNLPKISFAAKNTTSIGLVNINFLVKDLQKTLILTLSIIAVQLILLAVLKNHIFVLNGLIY
jgi:hypothetical protein